MEAAKKSVGSLDSAVELKIDVVISLYVFEHQISYLLQLRIFLLHT